MSNEHHNQGQTNGERPQHADVSFEATDVRSSPIFHFLTYLGITVIASFILSIGIYKGLIHYWTNSYEAPAPMREEGAHFPPEPRIQGMPGHLTDPQHDMREKSGKGHQGERGTGLGGQERRDRTDSRERRDEIDCRKGFAGRDRAGGEKVKMKLFRTIAGIALLLTAIAASAQMVPDNVGQSSKALPPALVNVRFDPQLNTQIPADASFVDEMGVPVTLGQYFGKRPVGAGVCVLHVPDAVQPGGAGGGRNAEDAFVQSGDGL